MHAWCARQMAWCLEHSRHTETLAILVIVAAAAANGEGNGTPLVCLFCDTYHLRFKESFFLQKLGMKYTIMSFMSQGTDEIKITRDHLTMLPTLCECEELPCVRYLLPQTSSSLFSGFCAMELFSSLVSSWRKSCKFLFCELGTSSPQREKI